MKKVLGHGQTAPPPAIDATRTESPKGSVGEGPSLQLGDRFSPYAASGMDLDPPRPASAIPTVVELVKALVALPGGKVLSEEERTTLTRRLATNTALSSSIRQHLHAVLETLPALPPDDQTQRIRAFIQDEEGLPKGAAMYAKGFRLRQPCAIVGPVDVPGHAFRSANAAPAELYQVTIQDHTVEVAVAYEHQDAQVSIEALADALAALPGPILRLLRLIRVEPGPNPQDPHWAKFFGMDGFRSFMTADQAGEISIYPHDLPPAHPLGLEEALIHEAGHVLSQRFWGRNDRQGDWSGWARAAAKDGLHVSAYARKALHEDFAETYLTYHLVLGTPQEGEWRKLFRARFAMLDQLVRVELE
ncbi:MAG: hypothetical protein IPG45_31595 [Deltaproteobacteria bacterium]|nr:hypothetical protein [Deltaproteobacteria bacterium]